MTRRGCRPLPPVLASPVPDNKGELSLRVEAVSGAFCAQSILVNVAVEDKSCFLSSQPFPFLITYLWKQVKTYI